MYNQVRRFKFVSVIVAILELFSVACQLSLLYLVPVCVWMENSEEVFALATHE